MYGPKKEINPKWIKMYGSTKRYLFHFSKTQDIQNIYDEVGDDRESYLNNPINTVTMLKRITSDWKGMTNDAEDYLDTEG